MGHNGNLSLVIYLFFSKKQNKKPTFEKEMRNRKMQCTRLCICYMKTIHTSSDTNLNKYASICKFVKILTTDQTGLKKKKKHASLQKSSRAPGVSGVTLQHWPGSSSELLASKAPVQSAEMHGLKHQSYKYTNQSGQRWTSKPRVLRVKITVWREHRETYSFSSSSVNRPYTAAVG